VRRQPPISEVNRAGGTQARTAGGSGERLGLMPFGYSQYESQRDSAPKPGVATKELPRVNPPRTTNPNGVAAFPCLSAILNFRKALRLGHLISLLTQLFQIRFGCLCVIKISEGLGPISPLRRWLLYLGWQPHLLNLRAKCYLNLTVWILVSELAPPRFLGAGKLNPNDIEGAAVINVGSNLLGSDVSMA
jgi:hypothetical protein